MRVFLAGATGVIGRPLLAALVRAGHEVTALTRSEERAATSTARTPSTRPVARCTRAYAPAGCRSWSARRVPRFAGRLGAGRYGVYLMDEVPGASNARAREVLGWAPARSWRDPPVLDAAISEG